MYSEVGVVDIEDSGVRCQEKETWKLKPVEDPV
jgi:hypothetical protein